MGIDFDGLVVAAVANEPGAWQALWLAVEAPLARMIARPRFLGPISIAPERADDRRDIALAIMARLAADDRHRLHCYLAAKRASPALPFLGWLHVVARRVAIDHLRAHPEYVRRDARWIGLAPLGPLHGAARPPITRDGTAREVVRRAAATLAPHHARAIGRWASGERTGETTQRHVRAAVQQLRRHFREES